MAMYSNLVSASGDGEGVLLHFQIDEPSGLRNHVATIAITYGVLERFRAVLKEMSDKRPPAISGPLAQSAIEVRT